MVCSYKNICTLEPTWPIYSRLTISYKKFFFHFLYNKLELYLLILCLAWSYRLVLRNLVNNYIDEFASFIGIPIFIYTLFFYKQRFQTLSSQSKCCLTFSWIELQMLLRCCLIHISIIKPKHCLYLLYLWSRLNEGVFRSYPCDFFFSLSSSFLQTYFFFWLFYRILLFLDNKVGEKYE